MEARQISNHEDLSPAFKCQSKENEVEFHTNDLRLGLA